MPPWKPRDWSSSRMVLSNDKLLASFFESSGIGIYYCLNINNGEIKWTTKPAPYGSNT